MQIYTIKTGVGEKRLWFQRLKLPYHEMLSSFAFNCNLRFYTTARWMSGTRARW